MAEIKKRILTLSSGKIIKLWGNSLAIGKSLEIGEGYAPNLFSYSLSQTADKSVPTVSNPHGLNKEEFLELADYQIRLWMDLKDAIRLHGIGSIKVFNKEGMI
ncbi:MAG: hypothetical protein BGO31_05545 [Bacteroidetes bacterium 43-16]|uniref:hypothetical protein n=1 Tax=uncultured Dysgonomonas sp. TaxID=206096 RepID=UPI00092AA7AB|nr:hypothetical protein [uncultured Dysgonomonas sp.]OJV52295.1 MAG: hypothetical protein BGO31_05545 [Bacteroidetes bacterium 43-16]